MVFTYPVEESAIKTPAISDKYSVEKLKKRKKLIDFDEYFTSALNGFKDAKDYYTQASSKPF